jgi:Cys-rich four helix bundle protein (predicted Tat secretion target)
MTARGRRHGLRRREVLAAGAGAGALSLTACASEARSGASVDPAMSSAPASGDHDHDGMHQSTPSAQSPEGRLVAAVSECIRAGEACQQHCLEKLAAGKTSFGECMRAVTLMLAQCRSVPAFALAGSEHLSAVSQLCAAVCTDCAKACEPHRDHHAECKACYEACQTTLRAAQALT